jgi:hypothetical protein
MNDILLTGAVTIVTASALWDFVKFIINRADKQKTTNGDLKTAIEALADKVDRNQAILARTHILRFDDELLNDIHHSKEYFSQQLQDIDTYESYCKSHPDFKNNYAEAAITHIKSTYQKLLEEHRI